MEEQTTVRTSISMPEFTMLICSVNNKHFLAPEICNWIDFAIDRRNSTIDRKYWTLSDR